MYKTVMVCVFTYLFTSLDDGGEIEQWPMEISRYRVVECIEELNYFILSHRI